MTAALMHAGANLRRRWRQWLFVALVIAFVGGALISLPAGARRTDSAYPRFLRSQRAADLTVILTNGEQHLGEIRHLSQVVDSAVVEQLAPTDPDFTPAILTDAHFGREINRFKLIAGRLPTRADEAMVGFTLADSRHLHVGSPLTLHVPKGATTNAVTVKVVGIEASPGDFPPIVYSHQQVVYLAPEFGRTESAALWEAASRPVIELQVHLRGGSSQVSPFVVQVQTIVGSPTGTGRQADQSANVVKSMHLQALALWLMGLFGSIALALILVQLLIRQLSDDAADHRTLRALGMTSRDLGLSAMLRAELAIAVGGIGAIVVSWLLSPFFPLGTARVAEPSPGLHFDSTALLLGGASLLAIASSLALLAAWWTSWRMGTATPDQATGGASAGQRSTLPLRSFPVVVATGIRFALQPGRGRQSVPARASVAAATVAIAAVIAAATFGASLDHLVAQPRLYGVNYDTDVELNASFGDVRTIVPGLKADPLVEALAVAWTQIPLQSEKTPFSGMAATTVMGSINPTIVDGRLPRGPNEILLGTRTIRDLHATIGKTIPVAIEGLRHSVPMRITGTGVLATFNASETLGRGAVITPAAIGTFMSFVPHGVPFAPPPGDAFVRFKSGTRSDLGRNALSQRLGGAGRVLVTSPIQPTDVVDFGQVRDLPQILAGLLAVLGLTTLAYMLVSLVRRRGRDLAILKSLGFVPRQVSAVVAFQSNTVVFIALLLGIPLGVTAGRIVWSSIASGTGVVVEPMVPWILVVVIGLAAVVVTNLVALGPAVVAGRTAPARVLRAE